MDGARGNYTVMSFKIIKFYYEDEMGETAVISEVSRNGADLS
jgi:hypothetical protein